MRSVYQYRNYRKYLRDFYHEKKRSNPYYSFRVFSMRAGFRAPNVLKLVMDGERNLTRNSVEKFIKGLSLCDGEARCFENLVLCNQGKLMGEVASSQAA